VISFDNYYYVVSNVATCAGSYSGVCPASWNLLYIVVLSLMGAFLFIAIIIQHFMAEFYSVSGPAGLLLVVSEAGEGWAVTTTMRMLATLTTMTLVTMMMTKMMTTT
jgi:hypothetical protein